MMPVEMMDAVVVVTGLLRLFLVVAVFYLNCRALFVVCFRSSLCSHNLVSTAVVLANILYLITWPPFLIYGLSVNSSSSSSSNGGQGWTPVNEQVFCLSQNYVVNAMGMVLLSLLVVRLTDRVRESVLCWPALGCTRNVLFTFLMWLLPQLVYDLVSLATNGSACGGGRDGQGRRTRPVFHFLGEIVRIVSPTSMISTSSTSVSVSASASALPTAGYSLGFMVCEQELTDVVVAFHLWQYLVLVVPYAIAALIFGGAISLTSSLRRRRLHRRLSSTKHFPYSAMTETSHESCDHAETTKQEEVEDDQDGAACCGDHCRRRMVVVDLILYANILWHLLGRPLVILHTLYWSSTSSDNAGGFGQQTPPPSFLDVGSHLMLAVSCCFAPTICGIDHALPSAMTTRSVVTFLRLKSTNRRSEDGEVEQDFRFVKDKPPLPA